MRSNAVIFWGMWSNVSSPIICFEALSIIIAIFVMLLGREIPRAKGSSSSQENLDNFFTADEPFSLVCFNAFWHCAYRQDVFIAVPLVQRVL